MPYHFKLPTQVDLTNSQLAVLDEQGAVAISGGPGTGKSIVSIWRHIRNYDLKKRKSILLTYTKTLQTYLASCAAQENKAAGSAVHRTTNWNGQKVDELIIDEAQDVTASKYDYFDGFTKSISYGADDQQILYPDRSTRQEVLKARYAANIDHPMDENFRNSFEVLQFTKAALPDMVITYNTLTQVKAKRSTGIKPRLLVTNNNSAKTKKAILDLISTFRSDDSTHNIGILFPFQLQVDNCYNMLVEEKIRCSKYFHDGEEIGEIEDVHVTTFKSSKGIEFDTVIIPFFHNWKYYIRTRDVVEENDYYVAFTRAKRNLYLISDHDRIDIHHSTFEKENL